MLIKLPEKVHRLLDLLHVKGFAAHVVGGCVRDSLMGIEPHDWDICTSATPDEMKLCFAGLRVIETGLQHGTLTVMVENEPFEVTTYREDGEYQDNRHPKKVLFVRSLKEDLSRRDFTINAMAYNEQDGLVDPYGGTSDLEKKLIRCVGAPDTRFDEDALRLIRALRFAAVFGFNIEPATGESIHKSKELLKKIAVERIGSEFGKLLCGQGVEGVLRAYSDVIAVFIPEIVPMIGFRQNNPYHCYDVWEHTIISIASAANNPIVRLTMLLHDIAKPVSFTKDEAGIGHFYGHPSRSAEMAEAILKRLRYDNATTETVKILVLYHDVDLHSNSGYVKRLMNQLGIEKLMLLLDVKLADYRAQNPDHLPERELALTKFRDVFDSVLDEAQCFSMKDLAVNGRDLIGAGIPQGTRIGAILRELLDMVINDVIENEKEVLLKAAKKMNAV